MSFEIVYSLSPSVLTCAKKLGATGRAQIVKVVLTTHHGVKGYRSAHMYAANSALLLIVLVHC